MLNFSRKLQAPSPLPPLIPSLRSQQRFTSTQFVAFSFVLFAGKAAPPLRFASPLRSCRTSTVSRAPSVLLGRFLSSPGTPTGSRSTLISVTPATALQTSVTRYSSYCSSGGLACTRASLGSGVLRRPMKGGVESKESSGEVKPREGTPMRSRRGRPPTAASGGGGSTLKSAGTTAKRSAACTGDRGRMRGATSSTPMRSAVAGAAASRAAAASQPDSNQEEELSSRSEKATSDNEKGNNDDDDDEMQDSEIYSGLYELSHEALCSQTSARLNYPLHAVRYVLTRAKEGATVPFLARYRQGETNRMDETQLRQVLETAKEVKEVHRRRQFMLRSLESRGLLTPALRAALESMTHVSQLEDAWEPYKERRTSLATRGRAEGLDRYASALLHYNPKEKECQQLLSDLRAAVGRVEDGERLLTAIVAEDIVRSEAVRRRLGEYYRRTTRLTCTMVKKPRKKVAKDMQEESFERLKKHFAFYDGKSWSVDRIVAHVVLALQRGEAKGVLQVETTPGPKIHGLFMYAVREEFPDITCLLPPPNGHLRAGDNNSSSGASVAGQSNGLRDAGFCRRVLLSGLQGAYDHLLKQLSTAVRRDLKKSAEQEAIAVFAHNLHHMLLQRPLSHSRILAMDPGHKHGVKCVVLDEHGAVETFFTCTLMDETKMRQYVTQVVEQRKLNKVVLGNGTASGETSQLVADIIKERGWRDVEFAVVSEAGASVYSVSDIAKEEFPTLDVMYRGAVSIGRRVLDPLSELVKIPVRSMGIGMYQHDVNEKELVKVLGDVLESCVARVGVNAVSASRYVMEKVPGIQKKIVDQIVLARHAKKLHSREDLRRVPAMTESVYEQIAGFFRFPNSLEPLDSSNIHPESYPLVRRLVKLYAAGELTPTGVKGGEATASDAHPMATDDSRTAEGASVGDAQTRQSVARALQRLSPAQLAVLASQRLSCTVETLELVRQELLHPGLDPRASLPHAGLLRREVYDVRDFRKGDVLSGVVQSVTMFGAFVDCGLHDSVLVRGDGVDTLQVGAYLDKRIRFDSLDHLKRPRMFLLPDPKASQSHDSGALGGSRHLHLESEDLLDSTGHSTSKLNGNLEELHDDTESSAASVRVAVPRSLSATIQRERKRRAVEEHSLKKTGSFGRALPVPATLTDMRGMPTEVHQAAPREAPQVDVDVEQRGQKRRRSPSSEAVRAQLPLSTRQQQPSHDRALVAPLMAASKGCGLPRALPVVGASSAAPAMNAMEAHAKEDSLLTPTSKIAKPAVVHVEEIDADAHNMESHSNSSGSDVVFSF
ncbi:putative transcription modulator/accessory protein [Leptomonas seymouri]|uniref:Putative transcription modulator/accessory protein n=1 Tax=Leptomonas seymouri TaxID=5684 RepID=A0A0N0P4M8_LEPSE|nr:putative transcription modulator/accessory protein [Leptomonas seymouri]|eukprot:KPI85007.1 putative transcription modulator/accessory protein [Leptomonas seymouri]